MFTLELSGFSGTDFADVREYDVGSSRIPTRVNYAPLTWGVSPNPTALAVVGKRLLASVGSWNFMIRHDRPWGVWIFDLGGDGVIAMATVGNYLVASDFDEMTVYLNEEIFVDDFEMGDTGAW